MYALAKKNKKQPAFFQKKQKGRTSFRHIDPLIRKQGTDKKFGSILRKSFIILDSLMHI